MRLRKAGHHSRSNSYPLAPHHIQNQHSRLFCDAGTRRRCRHPAFGKQRDIFCDRLDWQHESSYVLSSRLVLICAESILLYSPEREGREVPHRCQALFLFALLDASSPDLGCGSQVIRDTVAVVLATYEWDRKRSDGVGARAVSFANHKAVDMGVLNVVNYKTKFQALDVSGPAYMLPAYNAVKTLAGGALARGVKCSPLIVLQFTDSVPHDYEVSSSASRFYSTL
jgi:hypothetical protein